MIPRATILPADSTARPRAVHFTVKAFMIAAESKSTSKMINNSIAPNES